MEITIKHFEELTPAELYEILKERIDIFIVEQNCIYHECDGKDYKAWHLMAREGSRLIGYLRILPPGVSYAEASIGRVLVTKDFRGKGVGRSIMNLAIEYISKKLREKRIRISAQARLEKFYASLGFQRVSDVYLEDGIPHIEMLYE
jgi:ElaA protein